VSVWEDHDDGYSCDDLVDFDILLFASCIVGWSGATIWRNLGVYEVFIVLHSLPCFICSNVQRYLSTWWRNVLLLTVSFVFVCELDDGMWDDRDRKVLDMTDLIFLSLSLS